MKSKFKLLLATAFVACSVLRAQTELSDEAYSYVTMDLQGVLDLTMTSNPQVDFTFSSIKDYQRGVVKFNAVQLEVDATVAWDLYVYSASDLWTQVESFSTNGAGNLPPEILMISSSVDNTAVDGAAIEVGSALQSLRGTTNAGVVSGAPAAATQFLAGNLGTVEAGAPSDAEAPGTASGNPDTHKFRINYALYPGVPATFNNHGETYAGGALDLASLAGNTSDYAQAGYYYLEVVYSLVEDL